jgi:type 1 fimbriae regulatory protein FimB/type 1 fimbriae regulatory protein FimE
MDKSRLKLVTPATVNRTVTPRRVPNADLRTREYLTEAEVERLMAAANGNRWGHRDATMILVGYRHGLRVSELVDLRWDQVDFSTATLHVRRVKQGTPSTHPILGDELRALRRLQRQQQPKSPFVFTSERGAPFSTARLHAGSAYIRREAYEQMAIDLATHPEKLAAIKRKLAENRLTTPLFDTKLFTKHIEAAYIAMYERHQAGLAPDHISIPN